MKKTLTLLALMIAVAGAGQTDTAWKPSITDSIYLSGGGSGLAIDTLTKNGTTRFSAVGSWYGGSGTVIQTHEPKYDTIPIIYLYADTTTFEAFGAKQRKPITYWDFGYEVRGDGELLGFARNPNTGGLSNVYERITISYLDRQKNPIRKSMIIFNVKNIK